MNASWAVEDPVFWERTGARTARATLLITTTALTLSFATWFMWSAIVVRLPEVGFPLTVGQRFWLTALPGLVGATLRIPYSFLVQIIGTRAVVSIGTALLLIPSIGVGIAVQDPHTPFWVMALLACAAGFGGANFSAFMSSTTLFFPKRRQGTALGLQAGIGNFGVSLVQFLTPVVIAVPFVGAPLMRNDVQPVYLQNAAFLWAVPVAVVAIAAALWLRSIPAKASLREQGVILKRKHTWLMTSLYVMTFGTFSGFAAAFALLIKELFGKGANAPDPLAYAFLGALIGSAARPPGGWISDKLGGARVTLAAGFVLVGAAVGLAFASSFGAFLALMLVLFLASGIGNGSTFRMIPCIFPPKEAAPVLGWTAAVAAYGAFLVPMLLSWSLQTFGSAKAAFIGLSLFYSVNLVLCYVYYARRGAEHAC